jgi:hypothetical protein
MGAVLTMALHGEKQDWIKIQGAWDCIEQGHGSAEILVSAFGLATFLTSLVFCLC